MTLKIKRAVFCYCTCIVRCLCKKKPSHVKWIITLFCEFFVSAVLFSTAHSSITACCDRIIKQAELKCATQNVLGFLTTHKHNFISRQTDINLRRFTPGNCIKTGNHICNKQFPPAVLYALCTERSVGVSFSLNLDFDWLLILSAL